MGYFSMTFCDVGVSTLFLGVYSGYYFWVLIYYMECFIEETKLCYLFICFQVDYYINPTTKINFYYSFCLNDFSLLDSNVVILRKLETVMIYIFPQLLPILVVSCRSVCSSYALFKMFTTFPTRNPSMISSFALAYPVTNLFFENVSSAISSLLFPLA